jgi:hypothetical protein
MAAVAAVLGAYTFMLIFMDHGKESEHKIFSCILSELL